MPKEVHLNSSLVTFVGSYMGGYQKRCMCDVYERGCAHTFTIAHSLHSVEKTKILTTNKIEKHTRTAHTQLHLKQTASTLSNWMNKCWAWHGMAWSGKATGWKDYEFVWHCNIPIANETLVDVSSVRHFSIFFFVCLQPILIFLSLCLLVSHSERCANAIFRFAFRNEIK